MFTDHERLYTLTQACAMLDLRWPAFARAINAGELPCVVNARSTFIPESGLRAFLMLEILDPKWSVTKNRESAHKEKLSATRAAANKKISDKQRARANKSAASRGTSGAELGADWTGISSTNLPQVSKAGNTGATVSNTSNTSERDYIASAGVKSSTRQDAVWTENPSIPSV